MNKKATKSKYVPPGARSKAAGPDDKVNMFTSSNEAINNFGEEKQHSIRVLNINADTDEEAVKEFIYGLPNFPKIRKLVSSTSHRGFIFIKFYCEEDMHSAIPIIKGQRLNNLILDAEVAKPFVKKNNNNQPAMQMGDPQHKKIGPVQKHPICTFRHYCGWCILRDRLYPA